MQNTNDLQHWDIRRNENEKYNYTRCNTKFKITYWINKMDFTLMFSETDKMLNFINTYIVPLNLKFEITEVL